MRLTNQPVAREVTECPRSEGTLRTAVVRRPQGALKITVRDARERPLTWRESSWEELTRNRVDMSLNGVAPRCDDQGGMANL